MRSIGLPELIVILSVLAIPALAAVVAVALVAWRKNASRTAVPSEALCTKCGTALRQQVNCCASCGARRA
jgi:hypothetical protein